MKLQFEDCYRNRNAKAAGGLQKQDTYIVNSHMPQQLPSCHKQSCIQTFFSLTETLEISGVQDKTKRFKETERFVFVVAWKKNSMRKQTNEKPFPHQPKNYAAI
ncbi:hypothetical protein CSKR_202541 [Clonorchis sinensis]|uniref:Uncharacterized protein n=1 Tax=Clonorchis sinensis TaxID=79923 RepID=A0A8T1MXD0_CLOSI|nr:hypothetical protein CSKR_202541 [Clonorchis sinensis]